MSKVVFDASAVLALLNREVGHELVEKHLPHGIMSTVNLAEVIAVLTDIGMPLEESESITNELIKEIVDFNREHALLAARLRKTTKPQGLSLGDRACLALAKAENLPALTADKIWSRAKHDVQILLVR